MPCRDPFPYDLPEPREHRFQVSHPQQRKNNLNLYGVEATDEELPSRLMEIACQAFKELERVTTFVEEVCKQTYVWKLPKEPFEWWLSHRKRNERRLEEVRKNALEKFTTEEQEVLKAFFKSAE